MNLTPVIELARAVQPWAPLIIGGSVHFGLFAIARIVRRELRPVRAEIASIEKRVTTLEREVVRTIPTPITTEIASCPGK